MTGPVPRPWDVEGPADGPPIVFVHGVQLSRLAWRLQVERLRGTHRCISVDLPGHGVLIDEPYTLERGAAVVEAAIDAEAGGRALVVGLSLGGYTSMVVAGRSPHRVRGLVLAGCSMEPEGMFAGLVGLAAFAFDLLPRWLTGGLIRFYFRHLYGDPVAGPLFRASISPAPTAPALRSLIGGRFRERLLAYGGPILVLNGDLDLVFRIGEAGILRGVPRVRRRVFPWTTHVSNLDRPDEFTDAVRTFESGLPD